MGKSTLLSDNPSLAKEWHPTKNGFLTPKDLKHKSAKKVWWLCKKYNTHEWKASVFSRTYGAGCPYCASRAVSPQNCLLTIRPDIAKEWHPKKNGSLSPRDVTSKASKKVWWLCKKDNSHEWKAAVFSRTNGTGCPYCAGQAVNKQNCLLTLQPEVAKEWHPTKNGSLTPKAVTSKSNKRAWWLCKKDRTHEWEAVISSRTDGAGCPICYKMKWNKAK